VGAGLSQALVKRILQAEPNLSVSVPIHELCTRVGILRVEAPETAEFEGGVVTDAKRFEGVILAKQRRRTALPLHHRA